MVEKGITGGICHAIHRDARANNKYVKNYDKDKESSYRMYWDVNNLCRWEKSHRFSVYGFKYVKNTSQFNKDFIKNYNEDKDEGYFLILILRT